MSDEKEKEVQEANEQLSPKALEQVQGGSLLTDVVTKVAQTIHDIQKAVIDNLRA